MDEEKFLHDVAKSLNIDPKRARMVTSAVMHELHDRLTVREANDLAAQLPGALKAMWHSFDFPGRLVKKTHKEEFTRRVAGAAEISELEAHAAIVAVFDTLQALLHSPTGQEGEAWDVFSQLPKDLKKLWSAPSQASSRTKSIGKQPHRSVPSR